MKRRFRPKERPRLTIHDPRLKSILEAIWHDTTVRNPSHVTCWNHCHGYLEDNRLGLFYDKGNKAATKRIRRVRWPRDS